MFSSKAKVMQFTKVLQFQVKRYETALNQMIVMN